MDVQGSSSKPSRAILMPNEFKECLHLTQVTKSASILFVAQTGNASTCLSHSFRPWILESGAFDHLFGNKDIFFFLLLLLLYPWLLKLMDLL